MFLSKSHDCWFKQSCFLIRNYSFWYKNHKFWFKIMFLTKMQVFGMVLGSFWDGFGTILGSFWIILGWLWDYCCTILGSLWDVFGIILGWFLTKSHNHVTKNHDFWTNDHDVLSRSHDCWYKQCVFCLSHYSFLYKIRIVVSKIMIFDPVIMAFVKNVILLKVKSLWLFVKHVFFKT